MLPVTGANKLRINCYRVTLRVKGPGGHDSDAKERSVISEQVHLFVLDDNGIVFSERSQKVFALNTTATLIWCWLEQGVTTSEIVGRLAEGAGLSDAESADHIERLMTQWRADGLMDGGKEITPVDARVAPDEPIPELPDLPAQLYQFTDERRYKLLDTTFVVRFASTALAELAHSCFRHLTDAGATPPDAIFGVAETQGGYLVLQNGEAARWCDEVRLVVPVLKHLIAAYAIDRSRYLLNVHAGVVGTAQGCLLLPGVAGSGKSTLTAALVKKGYTYFSDEHGLLEHESLWARAVPLALCVKSTGSEVVGELFPELMSLPMHKRFDNKIVRYMPPPGHDEDASALRRPVQAVIFPQYDPCAETNLTPMSKVEALYRLMEHCSVIPEWFDRGKVARLVEWISDLDCHSLRYSSLKVAVELIGQRWR